MVHTPYGEDENTTDVRKLKLQQQAQQQFINQLQQRIAQQSQRIEALEQQIVELQQIIVNKDQELENYSKKMEEQRLYSDKDKKARKDREHELKMQIMERDAELSKTRNISTQKIQELESKPDIYGELNKLLNKIMVFYKKPTSDDFINSLKTLLKYCSTDGTLEQKLIGVLLKDEMPLSIEEILREIPDNKEEVSSALFRLVQEGNIKQVGQGYSPVTSEFAVKTDVTEEWTGLKTEEIFERLSTVIYVGSNKEDIIGAITKARDTLLETAKISPRIRHEMKTQIEKIKRHPLNPTELIDIINKWKEEIK